MPPNGALHLLQSKLELASRVTCSLSFFCVRYAVAEVDGALDWTDVGTLEIILSCAKAVLAPKLRASVRPTVVTKDLTFIVVSSYIHTLYDELLITYYRTRQLIFPENKEISS